MEDDLNKNRFLWGLLLAWAPWVPTMIGFTYLLVGINNSKAIGLAAVAGGMGELLVISGIATLLVSQVTAIVWMLRSLSTTHILRSLVATASIAASALMLLTVCVFLYWGRHILQGPVSR